MSEANVTRFTTMGKNTFSRRKPYILFLCTGNTCRSPMVYGVMKELFEEHNITHLDIRTAGVMTIPGLLPTQESRMILEAEGVDISGHRSTQMTEDLLQGAELILGMTSFHVQMALRLYSMSRHKTVLLKEFADPKTKNSQIQDPMGCTLEVYKRVFKEIQKTCRKIVRADKLPTSAQVGAAIEGRKLPGPINAKLRTLTPPPKPVLPKKMVKKAAAKKTAKPSAASGAKKKPAGKKTTKKKVVKKAVKKARVKKSATRKVVKKAVVKKSAKKTVKKSTAKKPIKKSSVKKSTKKRAGK